MKKMKNFIKFLLLFFLIISFQSCEKDLYEQTIYREKIKSENISYEELLNEVSTPSLRAYLKTKVQPLLVNQNLDSKFQVFFEKLTKGDEYVTYTLRLKSYNTEFPYFLDFVIQKIGENEKAGFVKYIPNVPILVLNSKDFSGTIQILDLEETIRSQSQFVNSIPVNEVQSLNCQTSISLLIHPCSNGGGHSPGESCNDGYENDGYYEVIVDVFCSPSNATINYLAPPNQFLGSPSGGGSVSSNINVMNFLDTLTEEQVITILKFPDILEYLELNNADQESRDFILNVLFQIQSNPGVFTSIKPFLIEKQIDDSQLDPCSKSVFEELKNTTQCDFSKMLAKLGADSSFYNIAIKTEHNFVNDINGNLVQVVDPANTIRTFQGVKYNYTIFVNPDYQGKTKLYIATFLLHEVAHTFFFALLDDLNSGVTNSFYELPIMYNAFVNHKSNFNSSLTHEEIANSYVFAISEALKEFQPGLPQQVYDDMAWSGLEGTTIFDTLHPLGSDSRQRILNRKAAEQTGHPVGQGTLQEQINLGQPCN